jgi:hypothetical protein
MQKKYGPEGLVTMTLALDDPPDPAARDDCLKFLQKIGASSVNLMLDEKPEFWQEKLNFAGVPQVFLFDRQGKFKTFDAPQIGKHYEDVKKVMVEWLQKK